MSLSARLVCDVSDYQQVYDPVRYRRAGRRAIMIKGCEGGSHAGGLLHAHRARASHAEGLRVLTYAFLRPLSGAVQARTLLEVVANSGWRQGDLLVADIEDVTMSAHDAMTILIEWRDVLGKNGHISPAGYSGRAYLNERKGLADVLGGWIVAEYGTWKHASPLDIRACGRSRCLGRQFTDGVLGPKPHTVAGVSGAVDCSYLTKTGARLIGV